jgi:hypothetical protein
MFVVYVLIEGYNALQLSGEWTWILYISIVIVSAILGEKVAQHFSNPLNIHLRKRLTSTNEIST